VADEHPTLTRQGPEFTMTDTISDPAALWEALAAIPDPEFGINIVDLGLIYSVECVKGDVKVVMTLTTSACPSGGWIHEGVEAAVRLIPGVTNVQVDLVFDPAWTTAMLSPHARQQLGWSST
jgi:metal-sulfur cluster biosynthetic enzyme